MMDHTIRAFDTDLQELARNIAEMGRLDGEQIADAIDALFKRDAALAERVIAADDRVDALQRVIEEKAVATIARRQPMAVDLREIVGALRIANDLERVGDLAENIAKRVLLLTEDYRVNEVVLQLQHMVDLVRDQLDARAAKLRTQGRRLGHGRVAQGSRDRCPQQFAVPGTPHLYDGGPSQHRLSQSYVFLRQEYRAHGRSRDHYRGDRLLHCRGPPAH